jgi:ornithine cyclodeaminase
MTTTYLDVAAVSALVRKIGFESFLKNLAHYLEEDFCRWEAFDKSSRPAAHFPLGVIELMPITDDKLYGFKFVNGHPKNTEKGLPTVMAFGVLAETETGYPVLLSEFTIMTALRTAAISALAAKHLARKDSRTMALIGNGAQAEFQVLGFKALLGINEVRVFDIDKAATEKLIRNLAPLGNSLKVVAANSVREAVAGVDIITTATADKTKATILTPDMIEPGMHINALGGDCPGKTELHPDVLKMSRVAVEYEPQTRIEGDLQQMPEDFPVIELWRIFSGRDKGREDDKQVTVFDSVGFALEDFSALRYLRDLAKANKAGTELNLIPTLADPKDIYGIMQAEG